MIKIIFVCHGNICRSPMAEFVMKELVRQAHREDEFKIISRATSQEEIGNDIYGEAKRKLQEKGIPFERRYAAQLTKAEYEESDFVIIMDDRNYRNLMRIIGEDKTGKVHKLLDFAGGGSIADPWYTGSFDVTYNDILRGCQGLLHSLS